MRQMLRGPEPFAAGAVVVLALALVTPLLAGSTAGGFEQAPPLRLPDLDGRKVEIKYSDARLTLVNFWATWCLPCREEMPQIERLVEKYGPRGFRAVGVVLESGEAAQIKDFLAREMFGWSYPILMGNDEISTAYGDIQIIPTTYLVGDGGEVLETHLGVTEEFEKELGAEIEAHLAGPRKARAIPARRTGPARR